jgi:hypothetical protein
MVVVAVLHRDAALADAARTRLEEWLGPLEPLEPEFVFDWTDHYEQELGANLRRAFWAGERLLHRQDLADLKRLANRVERDFARTDGRRRINLDPGLLSLENFVLASTKNQPQRVYLRDGIFAEVTLGFAGGSFQPCERTYPDYRSEPIRQLLTRLRARYKHRALGQVEIVDGERLRQALEEERS